MAREKKIEVIVESHLVKRDRIKYAYDLVCKALDRGPVLLTLGRPRRTTDQNAKLWPMLQDVSRQVDWYGHKPTPEEWKHIFTASLHKQTTYPGLDSGFVVCGYSTSKMNKREFADLIEVIYAFGSEKSVDWSEPAKAVAKEYGEWLSLQKNKGG